MANGQSSYFVWLNRGKDSVTLDLGSPGGKAERARLLDGADVLVQNLKSWTLPPAPPPMPPSSRR